MFFFLFFLKVAETWPACEQGRRSSAPGAPCGPASVLQAEWSGGNRAAGFPGSHRFLDLAAEGVDAEDLGVVVALGEGEAVALRGAVVAAHAEQDLVDGVVGDLGARLRVQQPGGSKGRGGVWLKGQECRDFATRGVQRPRRGRPTPERWRHSGS